MLTANLETLSCALGPNSNGAATRAAAGAEAPFGTRNFLSLAHPRIFISSGGS